VEVKSSIHHGTREPRANARAKLSIEIARRVELFSVIDRAGWRNRWRRTMNLELKSRIVMALALSTMLASSACSDSDALLGGGGPGSTGSAGSMPGGPGGGGGTVGDGGGGGTVGDGGDGASEGGADAPQDDSDAATCPSEPSIMEGSPCTARTPPCALCPANVACCRQFLACFAGKWQRIEVDACNEAAAGFACGDKMCSPSEYCVDSTGGASVAHFYSCDSIPVRCASGATCACVVPYLDDAGTFSGTMNACGGGGFGGCSDDGAGHVEVRCALP
jgi:hypothetical protein